LELIDTLAERVQQLGGVAIADPRHVAELIRIERAPNGVKEVGAMLARLLSAHETIITAVRAAIEQTAQNGAGGGNDLLIGDVLRTQEQQVWGVAEHLVTPRSFVPERSHDESSACVVTLGENAGRTEGLHTEALFT